MKNLDLVKDLVDFGLSENEARVYLSTLSLGPTTAMEIAKNADMNRTTIYPVVESLKAKGLFSTEIEGFKKFFVAEPPAKLERVLDYRKEKLQDILPELTAIHNLKSGQSFIKYYEGVEGVKSVYDTLLDDLKPGDHYLIISNQKQFMELNMEYFTKFIERRAKMDLSVRSLFQESDTALNLKAIEKNTNQEIRFLPKGTDLSTNLVTIPNKIIITQTVAPITCIVIENKSIVQMQHEQFEIIWKSLEKTE